MNLLHSATCGLAIAAIASFATAGPRPTPLPIKVNRGTVPTIIASAQNQPVQTHFNQFIVQYRQGALIAKASSSVAGNIDRAMHASGVKSVSGKAILSRVIRKTALGGHVVATSAPLSAAQVDRFLAQLRSDPQVAWAQPDYWKRPLETKPTDPRYASHQWDMHHPVGGVNAPSAWDVTHGEGTVVAVIDTGLVEHADLTPSVLPGYDFISWYGQESGGELYPDIAGDGNGRDADASDPGDWTDSSMSSWCPVIGNSSWHGTHVAGTVAAVANNATGIAGLAYGAKVVPVRVMGHCGGLTSDIVDGIIWASGGTVTGVPANENPAEVVNLSLGTAVPCSQDPATQAAIDGALGRGVTVVVAAGNDAMDAAYHSPASCRGVITVGATDVNGGITFYSNFGPNVSLSAPGGGADEPIETGFVWSLGNKGTKSPVASPEGDALLGMVGTSMAAPHVAAVAAMMQSAATANGYAALTPSQLKAVMKGTVKPFGITPPPAMPIGAGIVDASAAVGAAAAGYDEKKIAIPLVNRVAMTGIAGEELEDSIFRFTVGANVRSLTLRTYGSNPSVRMRSPLDWD